MYKMAVLSLMTFITGIQPHLYPDIIDNYIRWQPDNMTQSALYCSKDCEDEHCCACHSKLYRDIAKIPYCSRHLEIEYTKRRGNSVVYSEISRRTCFFKLIHRKGFLSTTPGNICDFPNVTDIDLSYNIISSIGAISCLINLDVLVLNHNRIRKLDNTTFTNLINLRTLDLSENLIHTVQPWALALDTLSILSIDMSGNRLDEIDVSDVVFTKPFCEANYTKNTISKLVNEAGFVLNENSPVFSGGFVDFSGNGLEKISALSTLISEFPILGKLYNFGFDIRGLNLTCDCTIAKVVLMFGDVVKLESRDYFDFRCTHPPNLAGMSVKDLALNKQLDLLICEITGRLECPEMCHCFQQTSKNRTVVDCESKGLQEFPKHLPRTDNIELLLFNNSITEIPQIKHYDKLVKLNISFNALKEIPDDLMSNLSNSIVIDITGNRNVLHIPDSLVSFSPCKIRLDNVSIHCSCQTLWLKKWLTSSCPNGNQGVSCFSNGLEFPASELTAEKIECQTETPYFKIIGIACLLVAVVISSVMSVIKCFRYELIILKRNFLKWEKPITKPPEYDAFISFNEGNSDISLYIKNILIPNLECCNYRIFIPLRDLPPGGLREEETVHYMNNSKSFIIMLSECYLRSDTWSQLEFRYAWMFYKTKANRKIIIVNFDHLESREIEDQVLKAFLRLGLDKDFSSRKPNIINLIVKELGVPMKSTYLRNAKPKLQWKI